MAERPFKRGTPARESSQFKEKIKTRAGEREELHKKTFTKWINVKLSKASQPIQITDLIKDLQDGVALLLLLEVLVPGLTLHKEKGKMRIHKMNNVKTAFEVLEKHGVKLVGINNSDIVDCKPTPILGLIWSIILRFQVQEAMKQDNRSGNSAKDFHVEKKLLGWCNQSLEGYEHAVKLKDFTASWRNGLAFNAILHSHKPELFDFEDLRQNDNRTNLEHAFTVASESFSVPRLLEPEDIDVAQPDKKLVIMYLTSLYGGLKGYVPQGKRRKLEHLAEVEGYRNCHSEILLYISQVEIEIASKLESPNRLDSPKEEYKESKDLINNIADHKVNVRESLDRGSRLIKGGKLTEVEAKQINDELVILQDRWEKLSLLAERLNKRCHSALIGPTERKLDGHLTWILTARERLARDAIPSSTRELPIKIRVSEHKELLVAIEKKQPEISQSLEEVEQLCADGDLDEEDIYLLNNKLEEVTKNWRELRQEALLKQVSDSENKESAFHQPLEAKRPRLVEEDLIHIEEENAINVERAPGTSDNYLFQDLPDGQLRKEDSSKQARLQEEQISPHLFKPIVVDLNMDSSDSSSVSARSTPSYPQEEEIVQVVDNSALVEAAFEEDPSSPGITPEKEKRKQDKLLNWKHNRGRLLDAVKKCETKLKNAKPIDSVNDEENQNTYQNVLEECEDEIAKVEPDMRLVFEYGNDLMADQDIDEEERETIMSDLELLIQDYNNLKETLERETKSRFPEQQDSKKDDEILRWRKDCGELDDKLTEFREILDDMKNKEIPRDAERFADYTAEVAEFSNEIQALEPKVLQVMNEGNKLLREESLDEQGKAPVYVKMQEIENKYEDVKEDISSEMNRLEEFEKEEELETWEKCKSKLEDLLNGTRDQLTNVKEQEENVKNLQQVEELLALCKNCTSELEHAVAEVNVAVDYSKEIIADDLLSNEEKRYIQGDVDELKGKTDELERDLAKTQKRLEERVDELHRDQNSKLEEWDTIKAKTSLGIELCRAKFENNNNNGDISDQLEIVEECSADLQLANQQVETVHSYGNTLLQDDNLDQTSKDDIKKDMETVESSFKDLQQSIENELKRLKNLREQREKENQIEKKLDKWKDEKTKLNSLLKKCRVKNKQLKGFDTSGDPAKLTEKLESLKGFCDEIEEISPLLETSLQYGDTLTTDQQLPEEERGSVADDVLKIRSGFDSLKAEIINEKNRLEEHVREQEADKKAKLDNWNESKENAGRLINKLQKQILATKTTDTPYTRPELESRVDLVKECERDVERCRPELTSALDKGNKLACDVILTDSEKNQLQTDISLLQRQVSNIEKQMADEKGRLEIAALQQNKDKEEKLDRWKKWKEKIKDIVDNCRDKMEAVSAMDSAPRSRKDIQEDLTRLQECEVFLSSSEPEMQFGLGYGTQLLDDDVLTGKDKSTVEIEVDQLKTETDELKRQISGEKERINMATERQDAELMKKLDEWKKEKFEMRKLLDNLKDKFSSLNSENPNNREEFDEQMIEVKEFVDELHSTQPDIQNYLDKGYQLLNNDSLGETAQNVIQRDIDQSEGELNSIAQQIEDRQLYLQEVMDRLNEQEEMMAEWREKVRMVRYGLTVAENTVEGQNEANQTKAELEDKLREIQGINQGFVENEKYFESTLTNGKELMTDDILSKENIEEVKADLVYMKDNWIKLKEKCLEEEKRLAAVLQLYEARSDEIDTWHRQCDQLQHWVANKLNFVGTRSISPDSSFGNIKRQQSVNEDLFSGLLERQDVINSIIDDGNRYVEDVTIPMEEREEIHSKMSQVHDDWDRLTDLVQERQRIAVEQQIKLETSHHDEIEGWRKRIVLLVKWIGEAEQKLNKQFAIAPDLDTVKKQRENIQLFTTEMLTHQQEVSGLLQDGDRLSEDEGINEEDRATISKENLNFGHRWEELEELITWKQTRLEDTINKLKKQQHDKLAKWNEGLEDVSGWVERTEPEIEQEPPLAIEVDSAYQQLEEMQYTVREAPLYQEKVNSLNEFSSNLMSDPCLGEEERVKLRLETVRCNEKWNEFVNIANARQARLDQNIDRLESEQNASMDQWKTKYTRSSNLLDQFEAGIPILEQPVGSKVEEVTRQQEHFEAFSDEIDANETQVNETCKLGERIQNENAFSKNVREEVEGQLNLTKVRWNRIKDFIVLRKGRLEEASKRLSKDRQSKLKNWENKKDEIDKMIEQAEREIELHEIVEEDLPTVRKQSEEFNIAVRNIEDSQKKVEEFGQLSDALVLDNSLDNSTKENLQEEKETRVQQWNAIVDKTNKIQTRQQERLNELEVGQASMSQWLDQLIIIQERVDDLHQVCESDLGPDYEALLQNKKETEDAILESENLESQVAEFVDQSEELKRISGISTSQRVKITKESKDVKIHLENLITSLKSRQSSIDIVFNDLEEEQHRLLEDWETLSGNTHKWLKDTAARVQTQDSPTPDLDLARAQKQDMEDLLNEMRHYEPNMDALNDVGDNLLKNPSLKDPERRRVADERATIMKEWHKLNSVAQEMQFKLDDKLDKLEKDQHEKLKVWEDKTNPLEDWLNDTEAEVQSYHPIGIDLEIVRAQRDEAQNQINELLREQPKFAEVYDYGNNLTREPCVGQEERMALQERMRSLNEKWDDVYGEVTKRHDRILEVLKPLEDEKKRKEEEKRRKDEELRQKREYEERKRREEEEERKRREEEERKRREEEERKRREEEERKRREEQERKRREEEERMRREEEERKRREQEERKRREEEEERRRKEEEEERKRREEEEQKRREEEERASKEELIALMMDFQPHVEKLENERQVFASPDESALVPVVDDVVESSQVSFVKSDPFAEEQERTHDKVTEWRQEVNDIDRWLDSHKYKLIDESDEDDLVGLRGRRKSIEDLGRELAVYQNRYQAICATYSEDLLNDLYITDDDLKAVEDDMIKLRTKWEKTIQTKEKILSRLDDKIGAREQELMDEIERNEANVNKTKDWIEDRLDEIDSLGPVGDDVQTMSRQKAKLKEISQEIVDFEPTFVKNTEECYSVSSNPGLTREQSHQLQCCAEDCEDLWDDLNESVKEKVDEILDRSSALQQKQQEYLQEWIDKHEAFEANLKKCNDKYDKNTPEGNDVIAVELDESQQVARSQHNGNNVWKPTIDGRQGDLLRAHKCLVGIRDREKSRKWSLLDTTKDAASSFGKRLRRVTRPRGIDLDCLVEHVEKHQELLQLTSDLQQPASEVFTVGDDIQSTPDVDDENKESIAVELVDLRTRWNAFNERCVGRSERLESLANEIENEYQKFDMWHDHCDNMNQWLCESEKLIKEEEKISTDVETIRRQIQDNRDFLSEVRKYESTVEEFFEECRDLMESSRLDKSDVEGVEKTRDTLRRRWNEVNEHLRDRQNRLEGMLLVLQKKNTEDTLSRWRNQSSQLKLWMTSSEDKLNRHENLDETDFRAIEEYATQVEDVESALESSYNPELNLLTDSGFEILKKESLNSSEQGQVTEELNSLNEHIGKLETSARLKKGKIKDASSKHFDRGLCELEYSLNELEKMAKENFSAVGSDIVEVKNQLENIQKFENELMDENKRFTETKEKFSDSKEKNLLNEDNCDKLEQRFDELDKRWQELQDVHDDNRKRIIHALIVLHEELMEEIYDWMEDAEKQLDSIQVDENDVDSMTEELGRQKELDEDISSFVPQFRNAMLMSDRMISEKFVDPERVETYEMEAGELESRMDRITFKFMDKSQRLSGAMAKYLTNRLDDAEIMLTNAEGRIHQEDEGFVDLEVAKQQLDSQKDLMVDVSVTQRDVSIILDNASTAVGRGYFKEPEENHFKDRISEIEKRTIDLGENASKEHKRVFDTYLLLLKQHLNRINDWLSRAEARMNTVEEIGTQYDDVKAQLEDHQAFQEELRDHSLISAILELDITDPMISQNVRDQVKSMSERWATVWNWGEQRKTQLTVVITNWQRFRDEQLILLNWLASKEKQLKDIGDTNLSDESEVQEHLDSLREVEKELDEQGIRLQKLHKAGDELLKKVDEEEPAAKEVRTQLKDFDDCWNDIAKQIIGRIQSLETSENKLSEYRSEIAAVNEWMESCEELVKGFTVDMDPKDATPLQEKIEIKCEEKPRYKVRVDRINRIGEDLAGSVDKPSYETIQDELAPFNNRWDTISEQLDIYSDKGYPDHLRNDCCFVRIMRRKFGMFQ